MVNVSNVKVSVDGVVDTIYRAVRSLDYINKKWMVEYFDHCGWVSLYSIKSGMEVLFPVIIKIDDDGVVELRAEEGDWAFFTHSLNPRFVGQVFRLQPVKNSSCFQSLKRCILDSKFFNYQKHCLTKS